jgi:hypothetical protein
MRILAWGPVALAAMLASPSSVHAQARMSSGMHDVTRATCTFSIRATGQWDERGIPKAEAKSSSLTLSYEAIDADDGTARLNARYGVLHVIARASVWSLHLLHTGAEGTVLLTTVFNREHRPGRFQAVHTIHEFTPVGLPNFASRPEQHYGECVIER